eukprot:CAMPEP_0174361138 /NCGR_PEP_ID=MMETSP0811_2-20130205/57733_1 /TAXON_ID=73025 ORGANISM="Eutreptiella gymnastica-like, Strain CCMP1594" /NCGR_SAMPLE_ID=MMETSP0811_2 /ASSEMBLY_ACC=CAM_ASM_000667 /LENGTH=93 /DNA_ID=CAMNT_0015497535 /DNA_START=266 /DNA_END=544 /DNA_ORIENTATION=+
MVTELWGATPRRGRSSQNVRKPRKDEVGVKKDSSTLPESVEYNDNLANMSDAAIPCPLCIWSLSSSDSDSDSNNDSSSSAANDVECREMTKVP